MQAKLKGKVHEMSAGSDGFVSIEIHPTTKALTGKAEFLMKALEAEELKYGQVLYVSVSTEE